MTTKRKPRPTIRQRACERIRVWAKRNKLTFALYPIDDLFVATFQPIVQHKRDDVWHEVKGEGKTPDAALADLAKSAATAGEMVTALNHDGPRITFDAD